MKAWEGEAQVETARVTVTDAVMQIGNLAETVMVEGKLTPLVHTSEPTEGATLDAQRIPELPINGRNSTLDRRRDARCRVINDVNGGVRVAGLMVYSTNYVQTERRPTTASSAARHRLGLESIGEVRVETSSSSAKYTTPTSVIITTRGGGNEVHGSLYWTHRNNAFGVARARQDVLQGGRRQSTELIRNDSAARSAAPSFPPLREGGQPFYDGRNRTFFFFSREGLRLRQGTRASSSSRRWRCGGGDFSELRDSQGRSASALRSADDAPPDDQRAAGGGARPVPNNQIPISRLSR